MQVLAIPTHMVSPSNQETLCQELNLVNGKVKSLFFLYPYIS